MILAIRAGNYLAYKNKVELSMRANMKIKRFELNTIPFGNINVLKAAAIYGPNNVGKTCLIRAINTIKSVLLRFVADIQVNWFSNNPTCTLGITFTDEDKIYSYDFSFSSVNPNEGTRGFIYEKFCEIIIDKYGNEKEQILFLKDIIKQKYKCPANKEVEELMHSIAMNNILIHTLNTEIYKILGKYKDILQRCATNIEVVDMFNIPIRKTLQLLKDDNNVNKSKVVELIKKADLEIDNYEYVKPTIKNVPIMQTNENSPHENVFQNLILSTDIYCLMSNHRGKKVPSLFFDSTGTKKVVALASYIIEALEQGKTLIVDELDSSLHFSLTREIVALFNNIANTKGQLIFTTQDISLLDCKKLFRKDQIWFTSKGKGKISLYSLDSYTAKDGIRAETDLIEQYKKGFLGAMPEPDLINVLIGDKI